MACVKCDVSIAEHGTPINPSSLTLGVSVMDIFAMLGFSFRKNPEALLSEEESAENFGRQLGHNKKQTNKLSWSLEVKSI